MASKASQTLVAQGVRAGTLHHGWQLRAEAMTVVTGSSDVPVPAIAGAPPELLLF